MYAIRSYYDFVATRHGIVTRIGTAARTTDPGSLHSLRAGRVHIDALPVHYDAARFEREFLANWPEGSPAHTSYYQRIVRGPSYAPERASRRIAPAGRRHRTQPLRQEGLT